MIPTPIQSGAVFGILVLLVVLLPFILIVGGMWKAFKKAGEPGWMAIIPILNIYIMIKISGNEWWWLLILIFVPIANIIAWFKINIDFAEAYGHGLGFGIGLALLNIIFIPIIGFGSSKYRGAPA
jgi:hypothetical protein